MDPIDPPDIIPRLVYVALRTPPMPERLLKSLIDAAADTQPGRAISPTLGRTIFIR